MAWALHCRAIGMARQSSISLFLDELCGKPDEPLVDLFNALLDPAQTWWGSEGFHQLSHRLILIGCHAFSGSYTFRNGVLNRNVLGVISLCASDAGSSGESR